MCLASLIGMFAVALWRVDRRELTLARDHVGIKPLYVAELGQSLAFASELKPLLTLAGVDRRIDHEGLGLGLTLGVLPAPWTLARGVRQLEPGEALRWRDGVNRRWRYSARIGVPAERERDAMPRTAQGRERALEDLLAANGSAFLEIMVLPGARADLGRPKTAPKDSKAAFMTRLKGGIST